MTVVLFTAYHMVKGWGAAATLTTGLMHSMKQKHLISCCQQQLTAVNELSLSISQRTL